MGEYIEREAVIRKIRCFAADVIFRGSKVMMNGEESCNPVEWTKGYEQGVKDSAGLIAGQPAADVAPVVHGVWEEADDGDGVVCSVCREDFCTIYLETERFNYCPNCGARMDGE